ncbi:MAG: hypothetical protein ACPGTP_07070 [Bacteroidia bacterium]
MKKLLILCAITVIFFSFKAADPCKAIKRSYDAMDNKTTLHSPYMGSLIAATTPRPIVIIKSITDSDTAYYMSFSTYSGVVAVSKKGLKVLFTDGTKWERAEAKIKTEVSTLDGIGGYEYSTFVKVTKEDLLLFETKNVKQIRLFVFDNFMMKKWGEQLRQHVTCIQSMY